MQSMPFEESSNSPFYPISHRSFRPCISPPSTTSYDREIKVFCKRIVSAVVRGYRHYSTCSVAGQYIIADPDRHLCSCYWMKCIGTSKTPADGFRIRHSIAFTARCSFFFVGCHGLAPLGCGHLRLQARVPVQVLRMWRQIAYLVGSRIPLSVPGGLECQRILRLRRICRSNCAASLSMRCSSRCLRVPPIRRSANAVMRMDHCIIFFLNNGMAASFTYTVFYLIICEYCSQCWTPVYVTFAAVGQAVI